MRAKIKSISPLFVNAEEMHKKHPDTFGIPESRFGLQPGDFAKVCCNGERFWAKILNVDDGIYSASVANPLLAPKNRRLKFGSIIAIAPCNIYQAMRNNEYLD
jgi:hypothetical protein